MDGRSAGCVASTPEADAIYSSSIVAGSGTEPQEAFEIIAGRPNVMDITL
jgi:hypothetical protein